MVLENIVVDITQRNYNTLQTIQYDVDSRYVNVKIVSSGKNVDLTDYMVSIACKKPDGKIVFNETEMVEPKQGLIKFLISEQISVALGEVVCELKIYGKNSSVLTTQYFTINVTQPISSKKIQSSNEFRQLTIAMNEYNKWNGKFEEKYNGLEEEYAERLTEISTQLSDSFELRKYKYLGTTFSAKSVDDPNTYLRVMLSDDGINWSVYSEYNDIAIRDPFVFKYKGYYYITGTNLLTHDKVGYLRTNDFKSFEHIQYAHTGLANYVYKWAPSVFAVDDKHYMIMSLSERDSVYGLNHYIAELDNNLVPKRWVKLEGGDIPEWSYDGHIIPTKNAFYFYFKREGGMDILKSNELFGEYKKIDTIDWDNGREAPFIMKPDVNTIRLYMDKWEGEGQEVFKESYDDGVTWTEVKPINIKDGYFTPKHMHVIEINGDNWQPSFSYEKYQKITSKWGIVQCNNNVVDLNEVVSGGYLNRMTTPATLNLPQNIDENEYGCATLINMQNGNYIQHIHFLSQKQFIRSYVNGVWSTYKKITQTEDGQEEFLTFDMGLSCEGIVRVHYRCVQDLKVVNLQGNVSGIQSGINHIGTLDEKFRTKLWVQQLAFNLSNWDDVPPIVELLEDGKINVCTRGASTIKPTDKVSFNITYVV